MYGEKSVLTLYTASSNQLNQGDVSFINEGNINLYGRSSTAIAINEDAKGLLTANSSFIVNKAINLYGDESVGLYVLNSGPGVNNTKNQVKFIIGAGNLKDNLTESYKSTNSLVDNSKIQLANSNKDGKDETLTEKAIGIFQDNGNMVVHRFFNNYYFYNDGTIARNKRLNIPTPYIMREIPFSSQKSCNFLSSPALRFDDV